MSFIAVAIGGSALAGLAGSAIGANAAGDAADKQVGASKYATDLQREMFNQQRSDMDPWRQAGMQALYGTGGMFRRKGGGSGVAMDTAGAKSQWTNDQFKKAVQQREATLGGLSGMQRKMLGDKISAEMSDDKLRAKVEADWNQFGSKEAQPGIDASQYEIDPELTRNFTAADFQEDPGYQFRMAEGQKALERSAAARGGLNSGGTMKALTRYGQDFGSNEYANAYNRYNADRDRRFGRLSALAGVGQTATGQVAQAGQNYANQAGQNMMGAANAQGAAGIAQANALGGGLSSLAGAGKTWMDYSMSNKFLDKLPKG